MTRRLPSRNILRLPTLPLHQSEHAASGRVSRPRVRLLRLQVAAALVLGMVWSLVPPGAGASINTWTTLSAPMTTARDSLGAVSGPCKGNLSATCLYALGGSDAGSNALNPVEMYDPSSNAWTTLSSSLATPRFSMGAASGPCQRYTVAICLYAIGGMDANNNILSSVARFDPTTVSTVPIVQGWNLLDLPLMQSTPTTASSLVSYLDGASQLGAGSVRALATYASGRFSLYVSGYSSNLSLQSTQGIFLLNNKSGTWVPTGVSYPSGQQIALQSGWSLVAAPFPPSGLAGSVIASEVNPAGTVKEVAIFQGGSYQTFVPGQSTPFHVPSTLGFWIECANPATWTPS